MTYVACGVFFIALALLAPDPARAAGPVVINCNDSGSGSLRGAIGAATAGDTIAFSANLNCTSAPNGPITLTNGTLTVDKNLTIDGTGATITVDGGCTTDINGNCTSGGVTVFTVNSGVNATLNALTIQHGSANFGGGIYSQGTLIVTNSNITHNTANSGGGIFSNGGTLTVTNSTITHDTATNSGGGIAVDIATLTVTNSTISDNTANYGGGGILASNVQTDRPTQISGSTLARNRVTQGGGNGGGGIATYATVSGAPLTLTNSTLSDNTASRGGEIANGAFGASITLTNTTIAGTGSGLSGVGSGGTYTFVNTLLASAGGNCSGPGGEFLAPTASLSTDGSCDFPPGSLVASAGLGTLGNYGGPTQTIPLLPGSPAIDAGNNGSATAAGLTTDQRGTGFPRIVNGTVDIGAYESRGFTLTRGSGDGQSATVGMQFGQPLTVTLTETGGVPLPGGTITYTVNPGVGGAAANLSAGTAMTNPSGVASVTATANLTPGPYTVTATAGASGTVMFNLMNNPAACQVNSTLDPIEANKLTLRGAVTILNSGGCTSDTITFNPAAFPANSPQKITLAGGDNGTLRLAFTTRPVTISGAGAGVVVDGGYTGGNTGVTVFGVSSGVNATLNALTIQHGFTASSNGGGIENVGALTVTNSTLVANSSANGGGIANDLGGTLTVTNSTFSGNSAAGVGGGISNANGQPLTVTNSTFSGNSAGRGGGGIFTGGRATLTNALVAASPNGGDLVAYSALGGAFIGTNNLIDDAASAGSFTDRAAGNIVGHPALLGTLGRYGGPTQTIPLLPGSPAIDAGTGGGNVPSTDQRGKPRVGLPDIGSFESQGFTLTISGGNNQSTLIGTPFANPLVVTATANNTVEPVAGGIVTFTGPTSGAGIVSSPLATPITGNMASVTVMANLIAGVGYPVQASVTGAMAMSFTLTNLPPTITLAPTTLPGGIKGAAYPTQVITAAGGIAPYTFTVTSSALPTGLTLNPTTGTLSGTPTVTGTFSFTVTATDRNGFLGSQQYTITITVAPLVSIAVTCAGSATPSAKVGQSVQCIATGTYQDGSMQQLPAVRVTWSGSNAQVATVEATTGKVTGESPGTIRLTATDGTVAQTTMVTIGAPTPIGIVVGPAPASRPGGASAAGSGAPTPAPSAPSRGGGGGSGSAPAPLPPGR